MQEYGPKTPFGQQIVREKYAQKGEVWRDISNRVASATADNNLHYHAFRRIMLDQYFLPAGRILAGAGTSKNVCLHNCFVSGSIEDSFVDGAGSIMDRAKEAAATMRMGGGIGYDFSSLRPRGSLIKRLMSNSTGPVSFMEIFNAVGLATSSSGHRRGAQMGILRVDHPDIEEFIHAKQNEGRLTGFNISIAITDEFMKAVETEAEFPLKFKGEVYGTVQAAELWETIMRSAWDWAEPGVVFIDRMNAENNLGYCETIAATNPCSEQPLPPFGACLLGSFNLAKYVRVSESGNYFDLLKIREDIPHIVRAMDNINDIARYPLQEQLHEALQKRRMGLGVMGLANAIEALGHPYGSANFLSEMHLILTEIRNGCYMASARIAEEKGAFPLFNRDEYLERPFIKRLDADVRDAIALHGIRNSHLISMAPTGTISMACDSISGGIEPTFDVMMKRTVHFPSGTALVDTYDYGAANFNTRPKVAKDVTADEHINVLCAAQAHTDSAVSKTCNVNGQMPWDDFKALYFKSWRRGAKSCSVFNEDGKRTALLKSASKPEPQSGCISGVCEM